jgi:hypothetical protein
MTGVQMNSCPAPRAAGQNHSLQCSAVLSPIYLKRIFNENISLFSKTYQFTLQAFENGGENMIAISAPN